MKQRRNVINILIIILIIFISIVGYIKINTILKQLDSANKYFKKQTIDINEIKNDINNLNNNYNLIADPSFIEGINDISEFNAIINSLNNNISKLEINNSLTQSSLKELSLKTEDIQKDINIIFDDNEKASIAFNKAEKSTDDSKVTYYLAAIYHNPNQMEYWRSYYNYLKGTHDNSTYYIQLLDLINQAFYTVDINNIEPLNNLKKQINSYIEQKFSDKNDDIITVNIDSKKEQEAMQLSFDQISSDISKMNNTEFTYEILSSYLDSLELLINLDSYTNQASVNNLIEDLTYCKSFLNLVVQENNLTEQIIKSEGNVEETVKQSENLLDYINQFNISIIANYSNFNKCDKENLNELIINKVNSNINNVEKCLNLYKEAKSTLVLNEILLKDSNLKIEQNKSEKNYTYKLKKTYDYINELSDYLELTITEDCISIINEKIKIQNDKITEYTKQRSLDYQTWAAETIIKSTDYLNESIKGRNEVLDIVISNIDSLGFFTIDQRLLITQVNTLYESFLKKLNTSYSKDEDLQYINTTIQKNITKLVEMENF